MSLYNKKSRFSKFFSFLIFGAFFLNFYLLDSDVSSYIKTSVLNSKEAASYKNAAQRQKLHLSHKISEDLPVKRIIDGSCPADIGKEAEDELVYLGELLKTTLSDTITPGEMFRAKIYIKNNGTATWYSDKSSCAGANPVRLGTKREQDRASIFWTDYAMNNNGWVLGGDKNRIELMQDYIQPGETGIFMFWSQAPKEEGIYREYFQPLAEGLTWFKSDDFFVDIPVGQISQSDFDQLKIVDTTINSNQLKGVKNIEVNLTKQKLSIRYGDIAIKTFPVSSGKRKTPTPAGVFEIRFKEKVRIATTYPRYIMPRFMGFAKPGGVWRGYGFHALPSLASDGGVFWTEALNHIGIPVSHGCVRLLPADSEILYGWTEEKTKVNIHY